MKRSLLVSAATIALVASASALSAADMGGRAPGGLKDGAMGVPVPAPMPYEDTYKYYIGGHIGWTFPGSGKASLSLPGAISAYPTGTLPGLGKEEDHGPAVYSLFFGRYITPSLRAELGIDIRDQVSFGRTDQFYRAAFTAPGPGAGDSATNFYDVSRNEDVKARYNTLMLNGYYDFNRGGRITPYVGAGVGISLLRVNRASSESSVCNNVLSSSTVAGITTPGCTGAPMPAEGDRVTSRAEDKVGVALSLMTGASIAMTERVHWDIGYRLMWQGATVNVGTPALGGTSIVNIGTRLDHEIRTGLRFDIW